MIQSGISPLHDEWSTSIGVLKVFERLEMITIDNGVITLCNWNKRQESFLTGYERVKKYREKQKGNSDDVINDNEMITSDKIRIDKNRIDSNNKTFKKPTLEEIETYCKERNNKVDANRFLDFYESKGWLVGRNKMKDWKACIRTWEKNSFDKPKAEVYKNKSKTNYADRLKDKIITSQ
jgi:hypothetical protein